MALPLRRGAVRILDFDIENRPLSYWYADRPTAEITAIGSCWADDITSMQVCLLGQESYLDMLSHFVDRYNQADIVTGHYIRKHDLPIINGALIELGLPTLEPKLTVDTKLDLQRLGDLPATQENLGELLGLHGAKVHMTQAKWREANRLTPKGLELTRDRVAGDVRQHMEMRLFLVKRGLLKAPRVWRP